MKNEDIRSAEKTCGGCASCTCENKCKKSHRTDCDVTASCKRTNCIDLAEAKDSVPCRSTKLIALAEARRSVPCRSTKLIALAGNPNVGKSTVFNALTGMKQHTGNWTGKTVASARGRFAVGDRAFEIEDIPGTYSLNAHSSEEEVARNFLCFGGADAVVTVCDATCLSRNLILVLQILEVTGNVVCCVNLMDEARRKGIHPDLDLLSERLGIPVVGASARDKRTLSALTETLAAEADRDFGERAPLSVEYSRPIEEALSALTPTVARVCGLRINPRWLSLRLLERDASFESELCRFFGFGLYENEEIAAALDDAEALLEKGGVTSPEKLSELCAETVVKHAERLCEGVVVSDEASCGSYSARDRAADRILTGKFTAFPVMALFFAFIFWLTISGANYPSQLLSEFFFSVGDRLLAALTALGTPAIVTDILIGGVYNVLAWVVSVMLPPMAIFFPLFTLLEDVGYLPRFAYNLDRPFRACRACGKQGLTMCMGFGCNAVGVTGCRIIDSPRERLLAVLTNVFVPCNGRLPALAAVTAMFFTVGVGVGASAVSALVMTSFIALGVAVTFGVTYILSRTLLRGVPSSFTLELPPYRKPQFLKILTRSVFDRTLFVLGRAVCVAAPAGLVIWILANVSVGGDSLLHITSEFLDPLGRIMGLDGVLLLAFILGFPANEIVLPIAIMAYTGTSTLAELSSYAEMKALFAANGWTCVTAVCVLLFTLFHFPCSTTLLTVKKETGSMKYTLLAAVIPTVCGMALCIAVNLAAHLLGVV